MSYLQGISTWPITRLPDMRLTLDEPYRPGAIYTTKFETFMIVPEPDEAFHLGREWAQGTAD